MKSRSPLIHRTGVIIGAICLLGTLTQCGPQNDGKGVAGAGLPNGDKSADPTAQTSGVDGKQAKSPQEEALRYGHTINSDFDKQMALQCYEAMHVQSPDMPSPLQEAKAYTIRVVTETRVWTTSITYRSSQGWKGVFCDFNSSGNIQLKDTYNY